MLTLNLPPKLEKLLAEMAQETGKSVEDVAFDAIVEWVGDWQDLKIAEERMRDFDGVGIPLEDVLREIEELEAKESRKKPAAE